MLNKPYRYPVEAKDLDMPLIDIAGCLSFSEANYLSWHSHSGFELTYVLKGRVIWELETGATHQLTSGQISLVEPGVRHRGIDDMTQPCDLIWIVFDPSVDLATKHTSFSKCELDLFTQILRKTGSKVVSAKSILHPLLEALRMHLTSYFQTDAKNLVTPILRSAICQIIAVSTQAFNDSAQRLWSADVRRVYEFIQRHFRENIGIEQIANYVGKSEASIYKTFSKETGQTPNDLIRRLRVEFAREQLKSTSRTITDIAFAAGFSSSQYFAHVFKRYVGRSPSAFRLECQEENSSRLCLSPTKK